MLIEKKPGQNDVVTLRLISGEEIVGRLALTEDKTITKITKPIVVAIQMLPGNQASLAFMPFLASTDEDSSISFPNHALTVLPQKTRADVASKYIQATSSIEIPDAATSSLITG